MMMWGSLYDEVQAATDRGDVEVCIIKYGPSEFYKILPSDQPDLEKNHL